MTEFTVVDIFKSNFSPIPVALQTAPWFQSSVCVYVVHLEMLKYSYISQEISQLDYTPRAKSTLKRSALINLQ